MADNEFATVFFIILFGLIGWGLWPGRKDEEALASAFKFQDFLRCLQQYGFTEIDRIKALVEQGKYADAGAKLNSLESVLEAKLYPFVSGQGVAELRGTIETLRKQWKGEV